MTILRSRSLSRITAPASEPLTLAETKLYLRVDGSGEDALITDLIVSSRMIAEQWLKRSLITQSWKLTFDEYVQDEIMLPMGPINAVTSVTIVNRDTTTQIINSNSYYLNAAKDKLIFDSVLIGFKIEILYSTGYGDATSIPKPIKHGILSHIAAMYDNRGEPMDGVLPDQAVRLYMPFREVWL